MRTTTKEKEGPHLDTSDTLDASSPAQPASKRTARPKRHKRSEDQRLNLKRAYYAFMEATKKGEAAKLPSASDTWRMRPYAASV